MGVTGFQFITSVNTIKRDDETRKRVRSHARRQKLPNEPSSKQSAAPKRASQKERVSKFRLNTKPTASSNRYTPPKSASPRSEASPSDTSSTHSQKFLPSASPASTDAEGITYDELIREIKIEPRQDDYQSDMAYDNGLGLIVASHLPAFSVLPIRTTSLTERLFRWMTIICLSVQDKLVPQLAQDDTPEYFKTYHSSFLALGHAMNPEGDWFDFITIDPAMTHGFMGLVAAMHCALVDWDDMTTIDFHRYETIKSINKRLVFEGKGDAAVSDAVIVSVALLVHVEAFIGSLPAAAAHLRGLIKMVEMRGGIEVFGDSLLLQRALAWADFAYATASQTSLSFPFIPTLEPALDTSNRFMSRSMMINAFASSHQDGGLVLRNREVTELFELLYSTTQAVNTFEFDKLESLKSKRGRISDSVYMVEYRLCNLEEMIRSRSRSISLVSPVEAGDSHFAMANTKVVDLSDALVYASHLYLHMALRAQPPQAPSHRYLVETLMSSLYGIVAGLSLFVDASLAESSDQRSHGNVPALGVSTMQEWQAGNGGYYSSPSDSTPGSLRNEAHDELHEDVLLWILFIGSCVQVPPSHSRDNFGAVVDSRGFFLGCFKRYCSSRGILDLDILTRRLRCIIWLDTWCERQLEMIWARIGAGTGP